MTDDGTFQRYLLATNELLVEFAREARDEAHRARRTPPRDFADGYLMGFYRVVSLFQQQADAYGIELEDIGLDGVDPNRDLT